MAKTKNISIRFDEEDLKICLLHSKQKTKQKLVDWFCRNYADLHRIKEDNPFKEKKQESGFNAQKVENAMHDEPLSFFKPVQRKPTMFLNRSMEQWIVLKRECEITEEWLKIKEQIDAATNLSDKQKQLIFNS